MPMDTRSALASDDMLRSSTKVGLCAPDPYRGPASVTRKVNREGVVLLGWGRAILLQLAHPLVAAAVSGQGSFHGRTLEYVRRMRGTVGAMLALTFGTHEEISRNAARINTIHSRVRGRLTEAAGPYQTGTSYSAGDPELLTWVHATLIQSQLLTYGLFVGPLTADEKDRYCAEASTLGPLLGVPEGWFPSNVVELDAYLATMQTSGRIVVTESARRLADVLLAPPGRSLVWPVLALGRLTTVGLLPDVVRRAYGFTWNARRERSLQLAAPVVQALRRRLPRRLREWPAARRADRERAGV